MIDSPAKLARTTSPSETATVVSPIGLTTRSNVVPRTPMVAVGVGWWFGEGFDAAEHGRDEAGFLNRLDPDDGKDVNGGCRQQDEKPVIMNGDEGFAKGPHIVPGRLVDHGHILGDQCRRINPGCGHPFGDKPAEWRIIDIGAGNDEAGHRLGGEGKEKKRDHVTPRRRMADILGRVAGFQRLEVAKGAAYAAAGLA